jgi:ribosome-binding protein aMBF1 (putative translation factor)
MVDIPCEIYLKREIYLARYILLDFTHNMEYIKCREVDFMSDFQSFLDKTLTQIDVEAIKVEDNEVYEYDIYREVRELVIAARDRAGLTQNELAAKSGLTQANISNIEKGTTRPTIDSLKKIADATGRRLVIQFGDREVML